METPAAATLHRVRVLESTVDALATIPLGVLVLAVAVIGGGAPRAAAAEAGHGLPQQAIEIARPFGFPITNSMVVTWAVAAGLICFARAATRDMQRVPRGPQNLLEWLVG